MFISKSEKQFMESRLAQLELTIRQIAALQGNVILLEKAVVELQQAKKHKEAPKSSAKDAYKRAKQRQYARTYYAKKKESKQLQVVTGTKT